MSDAIAYWSRNTRSTFARSLRSAKSEWSRHRELPVREERREHDARAQHGEIRRLCDRQSPTRIGLGALLQREHGQREPRRHQQRRHEVERAVRGAAVHRACRERKRDRRDRDGQVHVEHPSPPRAFGEDATEHGSQGEEAHGDADVDPHRLAAFARGEVFDHQCGRCRLHQARGDALQHATRIERRAVRRCAAECTRAGKEQHARDECVALADDVAHAPADRHARSERDEVARGDPRHAARIEPERRAHGGPRDGRHRDVHEDHRQAAREREEQQPAAGEGGGGRGRHVGVHAGTQGRADRCAACSLSDRAQGLRGRG